VRFISFIFRRVAKRDVIAAFRTGEPAFDAINEATATLQEYIQQDVINKGQYTTYLFIERERNKPWRCQLPLHMPMQ